MVIFIRHICFHKQQNTPSGFAMTTFDMERSLEISRIYVESPHMYENTSLTVYRGRLRLARKMSIFSIIVNSSKRSRPTFVSLLRLCNWHGSHCSHHKKLTEIICSFEHTESDL